MNIEEIRKKLEIDKGLAIITDRIEGGTAYNCRLFKFNCWGHGSKAINRPSDICEMMDMGRIALEPIAKGTVIAFFIPGVSIGAYANPDIARLQMKNWQTPKDFVPTLIELHFPS